MSSLKNKKAGKIGKEGFCRGCNKKNGMHRKKVEKLIVIKIQAKKGISFEN